MEPTDLSNQIDRIVHSQTFARKIQLRKLLEVLFRSMDSQAALTPELVIGELWPGETRTKRASDVATEMNRLRHALDSYYDKEGKTDPIIISLPDRSATTADSNQEKRWIVAEHRTGAQDYSTASRGRPLRSMKTAAVMVALCAAFAIAAYLSFRALAAPARPQFGRLDGTLLRVIGSDGKELWSKSFPDGFGPDWYYAQGLASRIWFGDLEGKGHTSVLFAYSSAANPQHSSTLICYSDRGEEKWRWTPGRELPELSGSPATFKTFALGILKPSSERPPRIVVSSGHDTWWQNQIAVLDSSGRTSAEYWHSGRLDSLFLADLDGDGKEEIVAAGINNGYHQATLVVLDPDHVSGASTEVRPEFQIHGMKAAHERLRLLFPRSDLNQAMFPYNQATNPSVEHGSIRLTVRECMVPMGCPVWYEFDKDLQLINAYAGEEFRSAHARFFQNGRNAHAFTDEEQLAFQKVRCLVGCKTEFVPVGDQVSNPAHN
jgi:hypothetical protein